MGAAGSGENSRDILLASKPDNTRFWAFVASLMAAPAAPHGRAGGTSWPRRRHLMAASAAPERSEYAGADRRAVQQDRRADREQADQRQGGRIDAHERE